VSWFETMTDGLFTAYRTREIPGRNAMVIGQADRDERGLDHIALITVGSTVDPLIAAS
jgi:hypothetical protein